MDKKEKGIIELLSNLKKHLIVLWDIKKENETEALLKAMMFLFLGVIFLNCLHHLTWCINLEIFQEISKFSEDVTKGIFALMSYVLIFLIYFLIINYFEEKNKQI